MQKTRTFSFGKIAYYSNSKRKINEVVLEIILRDCNGHPEFTASVGVWNASHTDVVACGQMLDNLYNAFPEIRHSILYETILRLWKKYHMKDISSIPADDRELICLLFPEKDREEIKGIWKDNLRG